MSSPPNQQNPQDPPQGPRKPRDPGDAVVLVWSKLQRIHDHFAKTAFEICASGRPVSPQLFLLNLTSERPEDEAHGMPADLIAHLMDSNEGKSTLARFMRELLDPKSSVSRQNVPLLGFSPSCLVQITEAWMNFSRPGQEHVAPSTAPDRKEVLMVVLHTRMGSIPVIHPIVDKPKRHCQPAPFPGPEVFEDFVGRMVVGDEQAMTQEELADILRQADLGQPGFAAGQQLRDGYDGGTRAKKKSGGRKLH